MHRLLPSLQILPPATARIALYLLHQPAPIHLLSSTNTFPQTLQLSLPGIGNDQKLTVQVQILFLFRWVRNSWCKTIENLGLIAYRKAKPIDLSYLRTVNDKLKAHLALLGANLFYGAGFTVAKGIMPR